MYGRAGGHQRDTAAGSLADVRATPHREAWVGSPMYLAWSYKPIANERRIFFRVFLKKNFFRRGRAFRAKSGSLRAAAGERANAASGPLRGTVSDGSTEGWRRGGR